MRSLKFFAVIPALAFAAACGRDDKNAMADTALNRDLSLANQVTPYQPIDSTEAGLARANGLTSAPRTASGTSTPRASTTTTRRTTRRSSGTSSSGSGTVASSSGGTVTTSSGGTVVKHTKRDAAIGAAAGAVIGATTSRDKVKGAIIGGVVGGVLGGVIGNNVDKTRKP
jgi:hypothetical protein